MNSAYGHYGHDCLPLLYPLVHIRLYVRCSISKTLEFEITQRIAAAVVLLIL